MSLSIEKLKNLKKGITEGLWTWNLDEELPVLESTFEGKTMKVPYVQEDAQLMAAAPSLLSELISLKEWKEELRGKIEEMVRYLPIPFGPYDEIDPRKQVLMDVLSLLQQD